MTSQELPSADVMNHYGLGRAVAPRPEHDIPQPRGTQRDRLAFYATNRNFDDPHPSTARQMPSEILMNHHIRQEARGTVGTVNPEVGHQ